MMGRLMGLLVLLMLVLASCGTAQQPPPLATDPIGSLPRSTKGYELYSWYDSEESEWHYVLITGTNRLKTYEEMVSGQNKVTGDEWVSLTAEGSQQLKVLLARIPSGEQVTWISEEWLRRTGSLSGPFRLPDGDVTCEIERVCRRLGILLEIAD